jgi:hypothetical protein
MLRHAIPALLIAIAAAPASAAPVTVYFTGVFNSESWQGAVLPLLVAPVVPNVTTFGGSFQFDAATADSNPNPLVGEYDGAVTNFTLNNLLSPTIAVVPGEARIDPMLGGVDDRIRFEAGLTRGLETGLARVELFKSPPVLLNSDAANVPLSLAAYDFGRLILYLQSPGLDERQLIGRLTYLSIQPPPPPGTGTGSGPGTGVPEPTSLTLLGFAAVAVACRRRRHSPPA